MKIFLIILGLAVSAFLIFMIAALCSLSSRISREEERRELLDFEINREDV